jgi:C1A family cysteine protease
METEPVWGYRYDMEDHEWLLTNATPMTFSRAAVEAPPELDPRAWLQTENQSSMGSCAGHARTDVLEICNWIATGGQVVQLSRMFAYLTAQKLDGLLGGDNGSTITGNMKASELMGICLEETFPYPNPVRYSSKIPQAAFDAALPHKSRAHAYCKNYQDVYDFLSAGLGGVQIGVTWNSSWTPRNGLIERVSSGGGGGHSVSFVGYSQRKDTSGRNYLWLHNSWGTSWGLQGYAEVAPAVVDQIGTFRYTEMIGMSDLEHFGEARRIRDWGGLL